MLPAFIIAGGVVLFSVVMTGVCYAIVKHEQRGAMKSPPRAVTQA